MDFPNRASVEGLTESHDFPRFAHVQYEPDSETVTDVMTTVETEVAELPLQGLQEGATIAIGVGSRGIRNVTTIVEKIVSFCANQELQPIIVPAMGSHGGATSEGQREILNALGITEKRIGAPIDARMGTERLDKITVESTEMSVHFSTAALEADAVMVINRVKPHTNFQGRIESGLTKMTVVGLGKQHGAKSVHSTAIEEGYVETLQAAFRCIEKSAPLIGGLALVENFYDEIARVESVPKGEFTTREPELLRYAYREMPTLPIENIDLLIVDEIGKEISGAGMDTNVIGRYRVLNAPDPETPQIDLIYVRGLTERTKGNGNGIGLADVTRQAAADQLDMQKTYSNAMTSGSLSKAKLPLVAPDDEIALETSLAALGGYTPETVRIVWIENTQELTRMCVSDSLIDELPAEATVKHYEEIEFENGTLVFRPE